MHTAITDSMGFCAETAEAQQALDGTFTILLNIDECLACLLDSLRMPNSTRQAGTIYASISLEEHTQGWKKQSKTAALEKSQLGFKDHITAAHHPDLAETD